MIDFDPGINDGCLSSRNYEWACHFNELIGKPASHLMVHVRHKSSLNGGQPIQLVEVVKVGTGGMVVIRALNTLQKLVQYSINVSNVVGLSEYVKNPKEEE